jgi:N-acyl-D-aspartate/D-glutamate deacylase
VVANAARSINAPPTAAGLARIALIDRAGIDPTLAERVIDAEGQVVTPGFIDNHAHVQQTIAEYPLAENFLRQGITTLVASLHSGDQPWPFEAFASSLDVSPNVGFFAGHSWTRKQVMGMENRAPTPEELEEMKALVDQSMREGALGLSTGLLYVPANFAETEEVIELAKVASNHHKAVGAGQWGWSERTLAMIDSANAAGLTVTHDLYPYTASSTGSSILFPQWALAGGSEAFAERIADAETRARIEEDMRRIFRTDRVGDDISRVQFRVLYSDESFNGKTLADYAIAHGLEANLENGIDLAIGLQLQGGFSAIYHAMEEEDVIRIMQHPLAMIETDGDAVGYGIGYPHPRSYGAFARVLARYVRELEVITLEEAIKKMTSMPAQWLGRDDMGVLAEGMRADVAVFDPAVIQDRATYTDPHQYSVGITDLLVNGVPVILDGGITGEKPGRWLRGPVKRPIS